jgi:hypothetical protein
MSLNRPRELKVAPRCLKLTRSLGEPKADALSIPDPLSELILMMSRRMARTRLLQGLLASKGGVAKTADGSPSILQIRRAASDSVGSMMGAWEAGNNEMQPRGSAKETADS